MSDTVIVTESHSIYKLLKIFSCFGLCQSPGRGVLAQEKTPQKLHIVEDSDPN